MHKKALVTGATGFVGFHVAKSLVENGIAVTALVRQSASHSALQRLQGLGIALVEGDILKPSSYEKALEATDYVFHSAAVHKIWTRDVQLLYQTNVEATELLFTAAVKNNVRQFIYTSSIKTIGLKTGGRVSDESSPYAQWDEDGDYGRSKFLAEEFLLKAREDIAIKILNPAAVIGPQDETLTPTMELIYRFLHRKIKVSLDTCMGLVDVRDVGCAHFLALERACPKQRYILCAGNLSMDELFSRLSQLTGIPAPRVKVPYWCAYPFACLCLAMSAVTRKPPLVHPQSVRIACLKPAYDGRRAQQELGLTYRSIDSTLHDTVDWLKNHYVPS